MICSNVLRVSLTHVSLSMLPREQRSQVRPREKGFNTKDKTSEEKMFNFATKRSSDCRLRTIQRTEAQQNRKVVCALAVVHCSMHRGIRSTTTSNTSSIFIYHFHSFICQFISRDGTNKPTQLLQKIMQALKHDFLTARLRFHNQTKSYKPKNTLAKIVQNQRDLLKCKRQSCFTFYSQPGEKKHFEFSLMF